MSDYRVELVDLLIQRTSEGSLKWKENSDNAVETIIGSSKVTLHDELRIDDEVDIVVTVTNNGKIADRFTDVDIFNISDKLYYPEMKSLLSAARRSASGADQILGDIIAALKMPGR